ncbi:MAG: ATP-grasp domain-containing protein [Niabella sp.]
MLGIPYTGCGAASSAVTFNKRYTVAVAKMAGIAVADSVHLFKGSPYNVEEILGKLALPLFVKPNNGGSSIGMSKVLLAEELGAAIEKAFTVDDQVLVEQMIDGREFTVGVYKVNGKAEVLNITEVRAHDTKEFFDFEAKYEGHSTEITPAIMDEHKAVKVKEAAKKIYDVFSCGGIIRIDFIYNEADDTPYMLEVNTIPGQSAASIVPQQVAASGGNLKDFYSQLVESCFVR